MKKLLLAALILTGLASCTENYSNGERIGVITQLSYTGVKWKSWEGHLNVTQTGMNSSVPFDFSVDNNNEDPAVIKQLQAAAEKGWKVKLVYHQTRGKNWFNNRGETSHFVTKVEVLDTALTSLFHEQGRAGRVVDTIYVVIDKSEVKKHTEKK
ncbi:hypothetical protein [Mucilaginibacter myungsuensis]|uniref:Uncharacterized protein n=1 Tax=Mucilaginibacter myungsuensis TaxID=649104 RepID=A0A929KZ97_9SPHI|nr:hypothetical protein [Mucilaginibacter myungsuensis]MBE9663295.1 hypothetical protein [Mucilaginibacter myungsuensis]MDN3600030.1 hypothetical protein [Mucilaginibacter myungsuensis]